MKATTPGKSKTKKNLSGKNSSKSTIKIVPNVIYIGHLPKHCEERELIGFLKQFGILTQLRLCRSQKTGGSKGYCFAKFQDADVATIVADTLNGYLLSQKKLVSHVLAPDQIHKKLFGSSTRTVYQKNSTKRQGPRSAEKMEEISRRLVEREEEKRKKLKAMGIDYDFPGYAEEANKRKEPEEEEKGEDQSSAEGSSKSKTTNSERSAKKKRKNSVDADLESPAPKADQKGLSKSERKSKKKKDKKRRKSAPS